MAPTHHETTPLFSPDLIPSSVQTQLPEGYTIRPLQAADYREGFLDILRVLTTVGDIPEEAWKERYEYMAKRNDAYYLVVIVDENREAGGKVVGTGALVVERKLCVFC
jgi:glucosamine-phosphate N-acetyltransferase